jgi:hypothetical protein
LIVLIANGHLEASLRDHYSVLTRWSRSGRAAKRLATAVRPCGAKGSVDHLYDKDKSFRGTE